jgi:hypothetical protein
MNERARIELDTSAKGLLARLGHDLRLSIECFEIDLVEGALQARFALASLRVVGTLHGERCDTSAPSAADRAQIERAVREEILHAERYGEAVLQGRASAAPSGLRVVGELSLCGHKAPIELAVTERQGALDARTELIASRFGIAPYRALGGALKVADRVLVRATLPLGAVDISDPLRASARWCAP